MPDHRPNCVTCKKPLGKYTQLMTIKDKPLCTSSSESELSGTFKTKEEIQKSLDEKGPPRWTVVRVNYGVGSRKDTIWCATVWDGKSYGNIGDSLFCSNKCAEALGRIVGRQYREAGRA